jgi:hypothetical protein
MKSTRITLAFIAIISLVYTSCIKQDFSNPPDQSTIDPMLPVNCKIRYINDWVNNHPTGSRQMGDSTIYGIVVADDRSGNLYKQIIIEDSTGGIAIKIDSYSLYNDYPVGRKVYIKLKDLYIGNYKQLPQIGYAVDQTGSMSSLPTNLRDLHIIKATYPNTLPDTAISLAQLMSITQSFRWINCRIHINNVEFSTGSAGLPYANPANISTGTTRSLDDCAGSTIQMYNSGYANFQPFLMPMGRGTITCIYSRYNANPQIVLNDTSDIKFNGARCTN